LGSIDQVVSKYQNHTVPTSSQRVDIPRLGLSIQNVSLNKNIGTIEPFGPLDIEVDIESQREHRQIAVNLTISTHGVNGFLFSTSTKPHNDLNLVINAGLNKVVCSIKSLRICSGTYFLGLGLSVPRVETIFFEQEFLAFEIAEALIPKSVLKTVPAYGIIYLDHEWRQETE
jgi:hypothetical protein